MSNDKSLLALGIILVGCSSSKEPSYPSDPFDLMYQWIEDELRVTPVRPPGGAYAPGTVVDGWETGDLIVQAEPSDCFRSLEDLTTSDPIIYSNHFEQSFDVDVAANFMTELLNVGVSVNAERVARVDITFQGIERTRVSVARLQEALEDQTSEICAGLLRRYVVIVEGFILSGFELQFENQLGAGIDLSVTDVTEIISIDPSANVTIDSSGFVSINAPLYVGFRWEYISP